MTNLQRKPKSWFAQKLKALNARLTSLTHFKTKAEEENNPSKLMAIDNEIKTTKTTIERTRLESNFAELEL